MTVPEAARAYIERRFLVVPLLPCTKKPVTEDWPELRLKAADMPEHFGNGSNVGIIVGDDLGTTDIDLDCREAVEAAAVLLPETGMIFGRRVQAQLALLLSRRPTRANAQIPRPRRSEKEGYLEMRGSKSNGAIGL